MLDSAALEFIRESNRIEGITRPVLPSEVEEYSRFMGLGCLGLCDMEKFVSVYEPCAELRDRVCLNVTVGGFVPIGGGVVVRCMLVDILSDACYIVGHGSSEDIVRGAYDLHHRYEMLHPFTDCNGRSGRMLWMWMMRESARGFLHEWYYQSLQWGRKC